jgi:hypothetical protein
MIDGPSRLRRVRSILLGVYQLDLNSETLRTRLMVLKKRAAVALRNTRGYFTGLKFARRRAANKHRNIGQANSYRVLPIIKQLRDEGFNTYTALADELTKRGIPPPRSKHWNATTVRNIEIRHVEEIEMS